MYNTDIKEIKGIEFVIPKSNEIESNTNYIVFQQDDKVVIREAPIFNDGTTGYGCEKRLHKKAIEIIAEFIKGK